jgi:nucleoside triphosphate pyrophosphatase
MLNAQGSTLILASASPRRKELLGLLGLSFEVVPSAYEEVMPELHPDPAALAVHLATEKARDVSAKQPDAVVLGADTIVALRTRLYGKPRDEADAARMLRELSGQTHQVITGVALIQAAPGHPEVRSFSSCTDVTFRALDEAEIEAYVATGEPADKAGAYAIQGYGGLLIEGIRGDYPNVVGLPVTPLALALRGLGFRVLGLP